ncbi:MAG: OsmC family protein, partial [Pseudomonadota bacterium]
MSEPELLEPSIDPNKHAIGIRRVSAQNKAATRTVMTVRSHELITDERGTDTGPTPLEMALSSLLGCEGVIINRCAQAMGFKYSAVEMDAEGEVDQRGSRGVRGVRPYFNWVSLLLARPKATRIMINTTDQKRMAGPMTGPQTSRGQRFCGRWRSILILALARPRSI